MSENNAKVNEPVLDCDVCMKEIPATGGHNDEADEYVRHFCGLECYARWAEQEPEEGEKA